eukprot:6797943-Prymnesium_polylepis.1
MCVQQRRWRWRAAVLKSISWLQPSLPGTTVKKRDLDRGRRTRAAGRQRAARGDGASQLGPRARRGRGRWRHRD